MTQSVTKGRNGLTFAHLHSPVLGHIAMFRDTCLQMWDMDNPERIEVTEPLCSALHQVGNMDEVISARICGKWLTPTNKQKNSKF